MSTHSAECCLRNCRLRHAPSMNAMRSRTLIRKTSLLRKIVPIARRSSFAKRIIHNPPSFQEQPQGPSQKARERRNDPEIMKVRATICCTIQLGSISSLRCQKSRTLLSIRTSKCETMFSRTTKLPLVIKPSGGARRDRTDDLMLAKHALSQLSYGPVPEDECYKRSSKFEWLAEPKLAPTNPPPLLRASARQPSHCEACRAGAGRASEGWWAWEDLNFRPHAYQARALTN